MGLRLHIDEHRLRQIDRQEEIGLVRGDLRFDHLYTIQVAILTITNLDRHDPFEVPETFNLHRVGIDRPSISIHVGFGAVEPKDRFVLKRDVDVIYVRRSQSNTLAVAPNDKIVASGKGQVIMGHALDQLASDGRGGWRMTAKGEGGIVTIEADHAISSAPMRQLARRMHPLPQSTFHANELKYRDFLTVALMVEGEDLFPDNWIYIHDSKVKVGRVQNFRSWSPEMIPDESMACVGLEYFCFEGDGLWSMEDDDLVALATKEMEILGLLDPAKVKSGAVVRQEKAYPVYDDAYAANVEAMRAELAEAYPTLHLVGRNGMHKYNNQDHAMMTAMLTVENIKAGRIKHDVWCVNEDAEYHEAGAEGELEGAVEALSSVRQVPRKLAA